MKLLNQIFIGYILLTGIGKTTVANTLWFGNDHFKITQKADVVSISMQKMPWESFSATLKEAIPKDGILSLEVKSEKPVLLRVDGFTTNHTQVNLFSEQIQPGEFQQLFFSLGAAGQALENLIFYVNPGEAFSGEISIKNLKAGSPLFGNAGFSVYPNPASASVTLDLPSDGFSQLLIHDSAGKVVYGEKLSGRKSTLSLAGYKPGVYVLKAKGHGKYYTTKITVQ